MVDSTSERPLPIAAVDETHPRTAISTMLRSIAWERTLVALSGFVLVFLLLDHGCAAAAIAAATSVALICLIADASDLIDAAYMAVTSSIALALVPIVESYPPRNVPNLPLEICYALAGAVVGSGINLLRRRRRLLRPKEKADAFVHGRMRGKDVDTKVDTDR